MINLFAGKTRLRKIVFIGGITIAALASSLVIVFVSVRRKRAKAKQDRDRDIKLFLKDSGNLFIGNNASLSQESMLGWDKLFEIALGIARGLEYLHQGCSTRILHLDIKPQNILLDKELCPKISDFGLAKLCPNRSSIVSMLVARGTIGYIAPEVFSRSFGEVSYKSDVYSYGMLVLEMVGGRTTVDPRDVDRTSEIYFPNYLYKQMEVNNAERDVEDGNLPVKRNMIVVGLWCIQTNPKDRPSMTRVVEISSSIQEFEFDEKSAWSDADEGVEISEHQEEGGASSSQSDENTRGKTRLRKIVFIGGITIAALASSLVIVFVSVRRKRAKAKQDRDRDIKLFLKDSGNLFIGNNASLSQESMLGWDKLFEIALGIARGLEYLHQGCSTRILHLDIKPQNILLDKELCPKISDFGLAKLCPNRSSIVSMLVARGTIGYIAPEVFSRSFGEVSYKSDVYSYGMLVLEMVGGRTTVDPRDVDRTSEIYFPNYLYKQMEVNNAERDVEDGNLPVKRNMIVVGLWCIQTNPKDRPSMTRVVEMLEGKIGSLEVPPKPYLYSPPRAPPSYSISESF
ncbi:hypothetical protein SASPL_149433 [Salvia splendens]|uniref:Protein kinase domain-containing protein n=1 Tax=Salvia splendens TaxID=180675 RepID=A0A8X8Z4N7_SALSN|nr:hypothetical protein SASPL_149433 [Salvia splendens]